MTFEYLQRVVVDGTLEVENVGECVIQANNDFGEEYYLIITTELGYTSILEYGPIVPDLDQLQPTYNIRYSNFEYSQFKIEKTIDKFLNEAKRLITQAKIVELEDIRENLINPIDKVFPYNRSLFDEQ